MCIARAFVLQVCTGQDVLLFVLIQTVCHSATCYKTDFGIFFFKTFSENKNIDRGSFLYEMLIALTSFLESIEKKLAWKDQNPIQDLPW